MVTYILAEAQRLSVIHVPWLPGSDYCWIIVYFPGSVVRESGLTSHQSDLDSRLASGAGYCRLWVRALFLYIVADVDTVSCLSTTTQNYQAEAMT